MQKPASLGAGQARSRRTQEDARAPRDIEFLMAAASQLRERGLGAGVLDAVSTSTRSPPFASEDAVLAAIFDEVVRRLQSGDGGPWYGYGAGFRRILSAARSFEDGYVLLVRNTRDQPAFATHRAALRERTRRKLTQLLWFPDRPPPRSERPELLGLVVEPMVSFCNEALAHWVVHGAPARDERFVHWGGQMMRTWRHNAAELLNLDSPEVDWPFDTENANPLN